MAAAARGDPNQPRPDGAPHNDVLPALREQQRPQRADVRWFLLCENLQRRILAWSAGGRAWTALGSGELGAGGLLSEPSPWVQPLKAGGYEGEWERRAQPPLQCDGLTSAPAPPGEPSACRRCQGRTPPPG